MVNKKQQYYETVGKIQTMLDYKDECRKNFGNKGRRKLEEAFHVMRKTLNLAINNKKPQHSQRDEEKIRDALKVLLNIVVFNPITPIVRDMTKNMCRLALNWDQNIAKKGYIKREAEKIDRILLTHLTMIDAIETLRTLNNRFSDELRYRPHGFQASEAYLKTLDEEVEDE